MRIAYIYTDGRLRRQDRVGRREAADDFLYGSEELRSRGHDVGLFELSSYEASRWVRAGVELLQSRRLLPHKVGGDMVGQMMHILPLLSGYDVAVVAGSPTAYCLAGWKWLGRVKPAIVAIQCAMFNYDFNRVQRFWTRYWHRQMWTMLFGEAEYEPFRQLLGKKLEDRVFINECGTDVRFWTPGGTEGDYVFAIGNDGRRDFDLLMRAAARLTMPFVVVTRLKIKEPVPSNVKLVQGDLRQELLTDLEIRDLYRNARLVVVPLKNTLQPSGQSVCLQAMACGKAVILSRIDGIWSKSKLRGGENIVFVTPGNEEELARALESLYRDSAMRMKIAENGRELVNREWDMDGYAQRVEQVCLRAVS